MHVSEPRLWHNPQCDWSDEHKQFIKDVFLPVVRFSSHLLCICLGNCWGQTGANRWASFTPLQGVEATGGMYRSDPVGGVANGIPRKTDTLASMTPFGDLQILKSCRYMDYMHCLWFQRLITSVELIGNFCQSGYFIRVHTKKYTKGDSIKKFIAGYVGRLIKTICKMVIRWLPLSTSALRGGGGLRNGPILCTNSTDRLRELQTREREGTKKSQITADILNGSPLIGTTVQEI